MADRRESSVRRWPQYLLQDHPLEQHKLQKREKSLSFFYKFIIFLVSTTYYSL
jgi:hypothetical protein